MARLAVVGHTGIGLIEKHASQLEEKEGGNLDKFIATLLSGLLLLIWQTWRSWPDDLVHVVFCDVGQGDAILIKSGTQQILIDGGRGTEVLRCLDDHIPFWDRTLELMIATHADADHIGGLDDVLENYDVREFISNRYYKDSEVFRDVKNAATNEIQTVEMVLKEPILGQQIVFPRVETVKKSYFGQNSVKSENSASPMNLEIISPLVVSVTGEAQKVEKTEGVLSDIEAFFGAELPEGDDYNNLSVGAFLNVGEVSFLLTGDIEVEGEVALLEANLLHDIDVLKVGHHGSKTSTSDEFLQVVRPEISIISAGKYNDFGHPSLEVMNRLMQYESEILSTIEWGDIEIETDGINYWVVGE